MQTRTVLKLLAALAIANALVAAEEFSERAERRAKAQCEASGGRYLLTDVDRECVPPHQTARRR